MSLSDIALRLRDDLAAFEPGPPSAWVYDPLSYAWENHAAYLDRYGSRPKEVVLVGMNPGPWGMAQTGVPFGEVATVREWLDLNERINRPAATHPKKPILGLQCTRSEVSGARLWGWARRTFETPAHFFDHYFVANYCPLMFLAESGRNLTPNLLAAGDRRILETACDRALRATVEFLDPRLVVGVGAWAESCARRSLADRPVAIGRILHPSPASPAANRGWAETASRQLAALNAPFPR